MFLKSIASAFPPHRFLQSESFDILSRTKAFDALRPASRKLLERLLLGQNGISTRHFCSPDIESLVSCGPEDLNRRFEEQGTSLAADALQQALEKSSTPPDQIDALFLCTCTGYLCPGLSSHVAEKLGFRPDVFLQDIVGLGCGAAIPTLRSAAAWLAAHPESTLAVVSAEICSAAFYMDDDPGVLVSLSLFGDGASASLWSGSASPGSWRAHGFRTLHWPQHRDKLRFENARGFLRNRLHREVPRLAAQAVHSLLRDSKTTPATTILSHGGGREVIEAVEAAVERPRLAESRLVLDRYGNLSSPSVLVALEHHLAAPEPASSLWLTSFGAGFAAHSCTLTC